MNTDLDVAVVGAGPHGLSAAVHLRRAGIRTQVFGRPMSFWKQMPRGMKLRSNMSATNLVEPVGPLSLTSFLAETGERQGWPVPLERFIAYGLWVGSEAVPDVDERDVELVDCDGTGFRLDLCDGGMLTARRVVVAAGIEPFKHLPPGYDQLRTDRVSHTADHRDMTVFAGQRVAVVGSGQSAFECAKLMHEGGAAAVEVLARARDVVWLRARSPKTMLGRLGPLVYAPTDVGPLWYSRLVATPDLFRRLPRGTQARVAYRSIRPACSHFVRVGLEGITLSLGIEVRDVQPTSAGLQVRLSDGTLREVDHLMFGTGYRVEVGKYNFLGDRILGALQVREGYPVLRRGLESSVPGLHFVGAPAAWSFGPILRFVSGSWYAGRAVARTCAREQRPVPFQNPARSYA